MESNSDVIDELHSTEQAIFKEIEAEKTLVGIIINALQSNVTNAISQSNRLVDRKLSEVDRKVKVSENKMYSLVEETSQNISTSVELAEKHIQVIDQNLTSQMTIMTNSVNLAITSVKNIVDSAKADISKEVEAVHSNMDQYIISTDKKIAAENDFIRYQLAGGFSLLACLICLWHITSHARHIKNIEVQKRIMAILWMVPIYSVTSWISLVLPSAQPYLGAFRDCYEAYVVSTFLAFLRIALETDEKGNHQDVVEVLAKRVKISPSNLQNSSSVSSVSSLSTNNNNKQDNNKQDNHDSQDRMLESTEKTNLIDRTESKDIELGGNLDLNDEQSLKVPCPCCIPAQKKKDAKGVASYTLHQCEVMAMQFVYIKILLAITPFILELCGYDYEGRTPLSNNTIDWFSAKLYILLISNLSVSMAFYGLLCFFHICEKDLAWCRPWPKFLCVKGVVFMTFWQDILLQCMSGYGMIDSATASQIQNLLICIEMLMASIAHFYVFPYEEWDPKKRQQTSVQVNDTLALYAFLKDSKRVFRVNRSKSEQSKNNTPNKQLLQSESELQLQSQLQSQSSLSLPSLENQGINDGEKSITKSKSKTSLNKIMTESEEGKILTPNSSASFIVVPSHSFDEIINPLTNSNTDDELNEQELEFIVEEATKNYTPDKTYLTPLIQLSNHLSPNKIKDLNDINEDNYYQVENENLTPSEIISVSSSDDLKQDQYQHQYQYVHHHLEEEKEEKNEEKKKETNKLIPLSSSKKKKRNNNNDNVVLHDSDEELDSESDVGIESV